MQSTELIAMTLNTIESINILPATASSSPALYSMTSEKIELLLDCIQNSSLTSWSADQLKQEATLLLALKNCLNINNYDGLPQKIDLISDTITHHIRSKPSSSQASQLIHSKSTVNTNNVKNDVLHPRQLIEKTTKFIFYFTDHLPSDLNGSSTLPRIACRDIEEIWADFEKIPKPHWSNEQLNSELELIQGLKSMLNPLNLNAYEDLLNIISFFSEVLENVLIDNSERNPQTSAREIQEIKKDSEIQENKEASGTQKINEDKRMKPQDLISNTLSVINFFPPVPAPNPSFKEKISKEIEILWDKFEAIDESLWTNEDIEIEHEQLSKLRKLLKLNGYTDLFNHISNLSNDMDDI